eukprot:5938859-Amphidinium_carterae.1
MAIQPSLWFVRKVYNLQQAALPGGIAYEQPRRQARYSHHNMGCVTTLSKVVELFESVLRVLYACFIPKIKSQLVIRMAA